LQQNDSLSLGENANSISCDFIRNWFPVILIVHKMHTANAIIYHGNCVCTGQQFVSRNIVNFLLPGENRHEGVRQKTRKMCKS